MVHPAGPADSSHEVDARLVHRWRESSAAERAAMVGRLCTDVELLARSRIVSERPGLDEVAICHELARRRYGSVLADAAYSRARQPR